MKTNRILAVVAGLILCVALAPAQPVYYELGVSDLTITSGQLPPETTTPTTGLEYHRAMQRAFEFGQRMIPYAVGEKGVEMLVAVPRSLFPFSSASGQAGRSTWKIWVAAPRGTVPKGRLFLPKPDWSGMAYVDFSIEKEPPADQKSARKRFLEARFAHDRGVLQRGIPGAAWFRYRVRQTQGELGLKDTGRPTPMRPESGRFGGRSRGNEFQNTFDLFTGGRALSENLQLDRTLNVVSPSSMTLPISSLKGITTAEYDWKSAVQGKSPKKDVLASAIPIDQHAIFFPSFQAMVDLMDEAAQRGTPVLRLFDPRSEDAGTRARYERQLCLQTDALSRILGPKMIVSVAFTGSDPYLRTGSDVAVLFEAVQPKALEVSLAARQKAGAAKAPRAKSVNGELDGVPYAGVVTPDRSVCSYRATVGKVVVVSNSLYQLKRIIQTAKGATPNLAGSDEYAFFRMRYPKGDPDETALLVLSDATIRRWCSPHWRIGASRRTRAAAVLSELQAEHLSDLAGGKLKPGPLKLDAPVPGLGDVRVTPAGFESSVYGTVDFLTPIAELSIDKVTPEESQAYERFRDGYHKNWRQYFDPIAIRFTVARGRIGADVTVRPLIAGSEYRPMMEVMGNNALNATAGDPHPESVFHVAASLDPNSAPVKQASNFVMGMAPGLGQSALNWIGKWATLYADDDPLWGQLGNAARKGGEALDTFMQKNVIRLPLALEINVGNPIKLTAFLTALRAFIEQTSPGTTAWESRTYKDHPYVRVGASEKTKAQMGDEPQKDMAVNYAATPRALIVSLNEDVLKHALDRIGKLSTGNESGATTGTTAATATTAPKATTATSETTAAAAREWKGESLAARAARPGLAILQAMYSESLVHTYQQRAWDNLPILNEWKRELNQDDPVAFHERMWGVRLVDPAGGQYRWNDEYRTMESTVFGCPAHPRDVKTVPDPLADLATIDVGVTFESDGIRARGEVTRQRP